jgi:hypothetical protein
MGEPRDPSWTPLHTAAQSGDLDAVRRLLESGADPNAREAGDNTTPLHWAAATNHVEIVQALVDAGADVHGLGDVHSLGVIGWATVFAKQDRSPIDVVAVLVARGARHHIFSAIALGDPDLIRQVVANDRKAVDRRLSPFKRGQTPLHFAISIKRYDILDLMIELGTYVDGTDASGQTALAVALSRGDQEAVRRLKAAGARPPAPIDPVEFQAGMAALATSTKKLVAGLSVADITATLAWYTSIGFTELARYEDGGVVNFGMVSFGNAEIMLGMMGTPGSKGISLWFYTDPVDQLYQLLKARQLSDPQAGIVFDEELYDPFYGGRQFSIRDPNGYTLVFYSG